jgi:hypothetical protein
LRAEGGQVRQLFLAGGEIALVDDGDFLTCLNYSWSLDGRGYARAYLRGSGRRNERYVWLHKLIGARMGIVGIPDHKDRNKLNCQRDNLRQATPSQNTANQKMRSTNTSGYRGVTWHAKSRKWMAMIHANGQQQYLGLFSIAEEAARAYDVEARKQYGEFAALNFPINCSQEQEVLR